MSTRFINVDDLDIFYAELQKVFATKCDLINVNPNIEGFQNITVHTDASNTMQIYAEGYMYSDDYSIAEGFYAEVDPDTLRLRLVNYGGNEANGTLSHAKGSVTQASGRASSSEGSFTVASGDNSHAEGIQTTAAGYGAHAEGEGDAVKLFEVSGIAGENYLVIINNRDPYITSDSSNVFGGSDVFSDEQHILQQRKAFYIGKQLLTKTGEVIGVVDDVEYNEKLERIEMTLTNTLQQDYIFEPAYINSGAYGEGSHVEGFATTAEQEYSHAEGYKTTTKGFNAHSEGSFTYAEGDNSHSEGYATIAMELNSHAEGVQTKAEREGSHAEGYGVNADAYYAHSEGYNTVASGSFSHTEGFDTKTYQDGSHAEGRGTEASKQYAHAEGYNTKADARWSHTEGKNNQIYESGYATVPFDIKHVRHIYDEAHSGRIEAIYSEDYPALLFNATENSTVVTVVPLQPEGLSTLKTPAVVERAVYLLNSARYFKIAHNQYKFVPESAQWITDTKTFTITLTEPLQAPIVNMRGYLEAFGVGEGSHAEGLENTVYSSYAHAEGIGNTINKEAKGSHIEGFANEVGGQYSHVEGLENRIEGDSQGIPTAVHVEGYDNKAYRDADYAHVEGIHNEVHNPAEFAAGYGNVSTKSSNPSEATLFSVGCGGENAVEIKQDGSIAFKDLHTLTFYEEGNGYVSKQKVWDNTYLTQFPALFSNNKQWFPDRRALTNIKQSQDCFAIDQNIDADNTIIVKIDHDSSISSLSVGLAPTGTATISPVQVTYTSDYMYYRYTLSDPYGRNLASLQNNSDTAIKDIIFPTRDADHAITIDCQGLQNLEKIVCGGYYRLGSYAFRGANSLNTLYLSLNQCTSIDTYCFAQSSLTDVYITNLDFNGISSITYAGADAITLHVPNVNLDDYISNVYGFKQIVGYAL